MKVTNKGELLRVTVAMLVWNNKRERRGKRGKIPHGEYFQKINSAHLVYSPAHRAFNLNSMYVG